MIKVSILPIQIKKHIMNIRWLKSKLKLEIIHTNYLIILHFGIKMSSLDHLL
jgi:hypothetical protein